MAKEHYAIDQKKERMGLILDLVKQAKAKGEIIIVPKLMQRLFEIKGISPALTEKYLSELKNSKLIFIDVESGQILYEGD